MSKHAKCIVDLRVPLAPTVDVSRLVCAAGVCGQKSALVGGTNWRLAPTDSLCQAHTYRFSAHTYRLIGVNSVGRLQSVGVCGNVGRRSVLFRRLTAIQMLNRQSTLVCSRH